MTDEREIFDKVIVPGRAKGSIVIRSLSSGQVKRLENPEKEKYIPPEYLDDLQSIVVRAFSKEFQGGEGQSKEEELLGPIRLKYPTEQPHEVWRRDIAVLAGRGITAEDIAASLFSTNDLVRTALNLNSISKADRNKKLRDLTKAVKYFWPSAPNIE